MLKIKRDINGARIYSHAEVLALITKACDLMGKDADDLPGSMTLAELDELVNGRAN